METLFITEIISSDRTAHVIKNLTTGKYSAFCFERAKENLGPEFDTEEECHLWAQDWADGLIADSEDLIQQPVSDSASCCD